jgi:hypothetical protein
VSLNLDGMHGSFKMIVGQLSEDQYRSYWLRPEGHIDTLRHQLALGGTVAQRIRNDLVETQGESDGTLMYRLLLGFSNQQLVKGDDKIGPAVGGYDEQLVRLLAHPSTGIRVLAFDNLVRITGSYQAYQPANTVEKSKPAIRAWQAMLDKGGIRYSVEPSPLPEFKSLEISPTIP